MGARRRLGHAAADGGRVRGIRQRRLPRRAVPHRAGHRRKGNVLSEAKPVVAGENAERAIDPRNAFIMTTLLRDVVSVRHRHARHVARTQGPRRQDGHDQRQHRRVVLRLQRVAWWASPGSASTSRRRSAPTRPGGVAALPIWISYMQKALKGVPEKPLDAARGRGAGAHQSPIPACATMRAASPNISSRSSRRAGATTRSAPRLPPAPAARRPTCATSSSEAPSWARSSSRSRGRPVRVDGRGAQNRTRIAQVAARLIAEHGITDWSLAKRKAARAADAARARRRCRATTRSSRRSPTITRCSAARRTRRRCARQREEALRWMRRLAQFAPVLVGGVAAGWATEHSDMRLELVAERREGGRTRAARRRRRAYRGHALATATAPPELCVDTPRRRRAPDRVRTPDAAQPAPRRRDRHGDDRRSASTPHELGGRCSRER